MKMSPIAHAKLLNAVTEFDRKESKKKSYNRYALGMYCQAIQNCESDMADGCTLRQAITNNFLGRLCDRCLVAAGVTT